MDSLLHAQLCAVASKNRSQCTSLLYSKRSLHAMILSFPLQDLQQLPFFTVYKDPLIHTCFCHTLWLLSSTFFLTLSHRSVLSLHTNITVSNVHSPFFKSEVLEIFSKTLPFPVCFLSAAMLCILHYPFAKTQVSNSNSVPVALWIASFTYTASSQYISSFRSSSACHTERAAGG